MDKEVHVTDLIPAFALGCLDEDEAAQVETHISACEVCHAEWMRFSSILEDFPLAIQEKTPPAQLKTAILEQAAKNAQQQKAARTSTDRGSNPPLRWGIPVWGALGLVIMVLLATSNFLLWRQVSVLESAATTALRTVRMSGTDFTPAATGMIILSLNGEYGTLVVDHLPPLDAGQQYQLWLVQDGVRTSGGVFSVSNEGYASLVVSSTGPLDSYQAFGITIEPYGGSPGPTGERVLAGQL